MISRYSVALNGNDMAELDENLLILDVSYEAPDIQVTNKQIAGRDGGIISRRYKGSASVTISFELHIYDTLERQRVLQKVVSWARVGGVLTVRDRENQRLVCECSQYPSVESVKRWTDPFTLTFTAYVNPYWEDLDASVISFSGRSGSGNMDVGGNGGEALVSCTVVAKAALSEIRLTAGSTFIELKQLSVPNNGVINISYTNGIINIKYGGTSLLNKRTAASSDNLSVPSGQASSFGILSNANVQVTFSVRGCWM